jgi:hypothetical protein
MVLAMEMTAPITMLWVVDGQSDGHENPQRSADESDPFDAHQVLHGKLESDRKHQENDADFRKKVKRMRFRDSRSRCKRTDGDPAQDVAENQRLPGNPGEYAACDGRKEYDGKILKKYGIRLHVTPFRRMVGLEQRTYHKKGETIPRAHELIVVLTKSSRIAIRSTFAWIPKGKESHLVAYTEVGLWVTEPGNSSTY